MEEFNNNFCTKTTSNILFTNLNFIWYLKHSNVLLLIKICVCVRVCVRACARAKSYHIALCFIYNRDKSTKSFSWLCNAINLQHDYSVLSAIHLICRNTVKKIYICVEQRNNWRGARKATNKFNFAVLFFFSRTHLSIARKFSFSHHRRYILGGSVNCRLYVPRRFLVVYSRHSAFIFRRKSQRVRIRAAVIAVTRWIRKDRSAFSSFCVESTINAHLLHMIAGRACTLVIQEFFSR